MNRRVFRKYALWLLPLLVARAFLPVGFMLSANAGGLQLVFCPGQTPLLAQSLAVGHTHPAVDHSQHGVAHAHHVAPGAADEHSTHRGQLDQPCPFALAAVALAADVPSLDADSFQLGGEPVEARPQLPASAGPVRADRIRGPPSLS